MLAGQSRSRNGEGRGYRVIERLGCRTIIGKARFAGEQAGGCDIPNGLAGRQIGPDEVVALTGVDDVAAEVADKCVGCIGSRNNFGQIVQIRT